MLRVAKIEIIVVFDLFERFNPENNYGVLSIEN
jgi:hypothetical protein